MGSSAAHVLNLGVFILYGWMNLYHADSGTQRVSAPVSGRASTSFQGRHHNLGQLPLYLFTPEQSGPFRELQRQCNDQVRGSGGGSTIAMLGCIKLLNKAILLIPKLPRVAKATTNNRGFFCFKDVVPGKRYHIIGLGEEEDGEVFVFGVTPVLKPGQRLKLDLSEAKHWTKGLISDE